MLPPGNLSGKDHCLHQRNPCDGREGKDSGKKREPDRPKRGRGGRRDDLVANPDFYDEDWEEKDLKALEQEIWKAKERFGKEEILISLLEPMHLYCLCALSTGCEGARWIYTPGQNSMDDCTATSQNPWYMSQLT